MEMGNTGRRGGWEDLTSSLGNTVSCEKSDIQA